MTEQLDNFVITWGELASRWGLNRTEASIHSLLFISPDPLTMEEIADKLQISRSNASTSLKELKTWNIIKTVSSLNDRRKRYSAEKDAWVVFRNVFNEQKRRNIDPFVELLEETKTGLEGQDGLSENEQHAIGQMKEMLDFFSVVMSWYGQINSMPIASVRKYLTMGSKIKNILKKE